MRRFWAALLTGLILAVIHGVPASAAPATSIDLHDVGTPITVGQSDTIGVRALEGARLDSGYTGTVTFSASCGACFTITPNNGPSAPRAYTFVAGDSGEKTFSMTWLANAAGTQSLTATGTLAAGSASSDSVTGISVHAATATRVEVSNVDMTTTVGQTDGVIVTLTNPVYVRDTAYTGTVTFSASCGACFTVMPNNGPSAPTSYTLTPDDAGGRPFGVMWLASAEGIQSLTVTATLASGGTSQWTTTNITVAPSTVAATGSYTALTPARILDTRVGIGGITAPVGPSATVAVPIVGRGGVPVLGVAAVAVNVTVTEPTSAGYLTVWPSDAPRPVASNLNFAPGQTVPNLVVVKLGDDGWIRLFNSAGDTHVIFDVVGWYSDAGSGSGDGRYQAVTPARILDTRIGTGGGARLGPGQSLEVQVAGRGNVPGGGGAAAAVLNVAVTQTTARSYLTVYPTGVSRPHASNLNFTAGDTVSNRVMTPLGTDGKVTISNDAGGADIVVDVGGWYSGSEALPPSGFTPLAPARILDTRLGIGGMTGSMAAGATRDVQITGQGGVPGSGVSAVVLNATVTEPEGSGWLTIFPAGTALPLASDLNYASGETRPNLVLVKVGNGGLVSLYSSASTHVVFDVAGWFS